MNEARSAPVGVIGAGPGGVAAGVALRARGLDFEIVDAGRGFGGIWDLGRTETPMYTSAHFISSSTLSGFPHWPMPSVYPDYPRHDLVLDYVRDYAASHDLARHATFGVRVEKARPVPGDGAGWDVRLDDGRTRRYRALCVATGMNWLPRTPRYEGSFDGDAWHAFQYRGPDDFRGRRVLVVGGGNTACDLACDAALVAERALISMRRGYRFVPQYVMGKPADVFAHEGPRLPAWLERRLFAFLLDRVLVGDLTRYGLPRPDHPLLMSHPVMNTRILDHLGHGELEARPDVARLDGRTVRFTDGRADEVDLIVWATGYRRGFPFLPDDVLERRGGVLDLYLNVFHRRRSDLFFLGLFETDGAAFPLLGLQAELVAGCLAERVHDERRARRFDERRARERADLRGGRRYLDTPRHDYYVHFDSYRRVLEKELGRQAGQSQPNTPAVSRA
jgi:cation diffusion facilitator CzcD-associated flavoprotein CzcO